MAVANDVVITGIGLVSCLGTGADETWSALTAGGPAIVDSETFAPYAVHPLPEVDWSTQVPKRGDLRQMEAWQRIGTFTAGLALEDAGMKDDEALTTTMDMIIAAAGGERDIDVDTQILNAAADGRNDHDVLINETLTTELRPTLFLAQLSNLLAGNISIVHKVTGSSRTFMGEEGAGISALETAAARIRAGQSTHALVGASYNTEHKDMLLGSEVNHHLARGGWAPVFDRDNLEGGGMITGSGGAFLVLESRAHAEARGAKIHATLGKICADQGPGDSEKTQKRLAALAEATGIAETDVVLSAATGAKQRLDDEKEFIAANLGSIRVHATASRTGSLREAQSLFSTAVAALALSRAAPVPAMDETSETAADTAPRSVGIVSIGQQSGEGMIIVHGPEGSGN